MYSQYYFKKTWSVFIFVETWNLFKISFYAVDLVTPVVHNTVKVPRTGLGLENVISNNDSKRKLNCKQEKRA